MPSTDGPQAATNSLKLPNSLGFQAHCACHNFHLFFRLLFELALTNNVIEYKYCQAAAAAVVVVVESGVWLKEVCVCVCVWGLWEFQLLAQTDDLSLSQLANLLATNLLTLVLPRFTLRQCR